MKRILFLFLLSFLTVTVFSQYQPSKMVTINNPIGVVQGQALDGRTYYRDTTNKVYRPFRSTAEVLSYLPLSVNRVGQYPIEVHVGGTLNGDGSYTGGTNMEYWFKDGTADSNLVIKELVNPTNSTNWNIAYNKRITGITYDSVSRILTIALFDGTFLTDTLKVATGSGGANNYTSAISYDTSTHVFTLQRAGLANLVTSIPTSGGGGSQGIQDVLNIKDTITASNQVIAGNGTNNLLWMNFHNIDTRYLNRVRLFSDGGQASANFLPTVIQLIGGDSVSVTGTFGPGTGKFSVTSPTILYSTLRLTSQAGVGGVDSPYVKGADGTVKTISPTYYGTGGGGGSGVSLTDSTLTGDGVSTPLKLTSNIVKSINYFNKPFPFNNNSIFTGTSIFAGYLLDAGQSIINILQRILGNTGVINLAVPSTATRTACWKIAGAATAPWDAPMLSDAAFNNCRWGFATSGIDTAHAFSIINAGARWMAAAQFQNNLQFYRTTAGTVNPNCTITGSAVSVLPADTLKDLASRTLAYAGSSPFWRQSMAANDSLIMTNVAGQVISVGLWSDSVGGSRAQIYADGVLKGTYDPNGRTIMWVDFDAPSSFVRQGLQPDVFIIHGLADTMHIIVVKFLDAGKFGGVDFIGGLKTPQQAALNPIYMMDVLHMTSAGYAVTSGSSAVQDSASNSRWANVLATFPEYQSAMVRFNVNTPFGPYDPVNTEGSGVHPNGIGARQVAAGIAAVCNPKATHNAATITVPGSNEQLLNNNSGSLGAIAAKYHTPLAQLDLGSYNSLGSSLVIGDLRFNSFNSTNTTISYNGDIYSGAFRYAKNGKATFLQFGSGYAMFSFSPSGTAGNAATLGVGIYFGEDGRIGFNGNNVLPGSYLDLIQSSTSFASLNIPKGTRPTSPNNGDMYHDSDDHFYMYLFGAWNRLDNQLGTIGTTNQVIFNDGTGPTGESNFIWDHTNHWLGIGGTPAYKLDLGGYNGVGAAYHQGDFFQQSVDGSNCFHGFNVQVTGGAYKRVLSKAASAHFYFSDGSMAFATAPSGSAGSTITWNYGLYAQANGQFQIGGNASFTPVSWLDLAPSTTSFASLNIPSGTAPSSPHDADLWYDGTHLDFHHGSTTTDLLAGGGSSLTIGAIDSLIKSVNGIQIAGTKLVGQTADDTHLGFMPAYMYAHLDSMIRGLSKDTLNVYPSGSVGLLGGYTNNKDTVFLNRLVAGTNMTGTKGSDSSNIIALIDNPVLAGSLTTPKLVGSGTPTIAAGSGAGSGPSVSINGTALSGRITVAAGASPPINSIICTVTLPVTMGSTNYNIIFSPTTVSAGAMNGTVFALAASTTTFTLNAGATALTAAGSYTWDYIIVAR